MSLLPAVPEERKRRLPRPHLPHLPFHGKAPHGACRSRALRDGFTGARWSWTAQATLNENDSTREMPAKVSGVLYGNENLLIFVPHQHFGSGPAPAAWNADGTWAKARDGLGAPGRHYSLLALRGSDGPVLFQISNETGQRPAWLQ